MELKINFLGENRDADFQDWASDEASTLKNDIVFYLPEAQTKQPSKTIHPDEAGGVFDSVVKVLFGQEFLEKIVDIFKTWIEQRGVILAAKKPRIQITVKDDKGNEKNITLEGNFTNSKELIEQLKSILQ